jgi:hypothetical protein
VRRALHLIINGHFHGFVSNLKNVKVNFKYIFASGEGATPYAPTYRNQFYKVVLAKFVMTDSCFLFASPL